MKIKIAELENNADDCLQDTFESLKHFIIK